MRRDVLVVLILSLCATRLCFADGPAGFNNDERQAMPAYHPAFTTVAAGFQLASVPPDESITNSSAAIRQYYIDYLAYIKTLPNPTAMAREWRNLLGKLKNALNSGLPVDKQTVGEILSRAVKFQDEFLLSGNVALEYAFAIMDTLKVVVSVKSADSGIVSSALFKLERFLGIDTSDPGMVLRGFDNAQKAVFLASFKELTAEMLKVDPDSVSSITRVRVVVGLMRLLTAALEAPGSTNLTQASTEILNLISNYINSPEFKGLSSEHQIGVIWNLSQAAKEIIRNSANDAASPGLIAKVSKTLKAVISNGNTHVQAFAINELLSLVNVAAQNNNKEIAGSLLGNLQANGEMGVIVDKLIARLNIDSGASLEERSDIADALSNLLSYSGDINKAEGRQLEEYFKKMENAIGDYLGYVNGRNVKIGPRDKERLVGTFLKLAQNKLLGTKLRITATDALGVIINSSDVSAEVKEKLAEPLKNIVKNEADAALRRSALSALGRIANDPNVGPIVKESLASGLLVIAQDNKLESSLRWGALYALGGITSDSKVSPALKEELVNPILEIVKNNSLGLDLRSAAIDVLISIINDPGVDYSVKESLALGLSAIAADSAFKPTLRQTILYALVNVTNDPKVSAAAKESLADNLLAIATDTKSDSAFKEASLGALRGITRDSKVSGAVRDKIQAAISTQIVSDEARIILDKFGVVLLELDRKLDAGELDVIYTVLSALPKEMLPNVLSLKPDNSVTDAGLIYAGLYDSKTTVIYLAQINDKTWEPRALFHEIGHYLDFKQLKPAQRDKMDGFWKNPQQPGDFARDYGMANRLEDLATMFEAYTFDTMAILAQAAANKKPDILLQKVELMADIFAHTLTLPDGAQLKVTYIFYRHDDGSITRKEVALTEQIINGKVYLLPEFSKNI